jgi:multidrug efflux pump subunit AcrB
VYTNGVPRLVKTIGEATVKVANGAPVLVSDVAHVEDGGTPETQSLSVNGKDAILLNVLRIPGGHTIEIVDAVKKVVENLRDLPNGMQAKVYFDQSLFVRTAYRGLKKEIFQALALIAMVILLFLQSVRGTIIISVAVPLSFAITLIVLYSTGQTLNAFTLGVSLWRWADSSTMPLSCSSRFTAFSGWE